MIEILSLPRRPTTKIGQTKGSKTGLPINSLPGWEQIPLNSKLPMLKCPDNQVIFSKNKIGQSFRYLKQEFDPSGRDNYPEYNALHDSNLKTFYSNERNLKRLRENGEITCNNDVICNLKDFNEYRQQLHKTQLYYILQELNRLEAEQHDRLLIAKAELITSHDHRHLSARQHTYSEILLRKERLDILRQHKFELIQEKTEEKFERIAGMADMQKAMIEHKKLLHQMNMQRHWEVSNDLQRKHLISMKKLYQFKKDRMKKNLRLLAENREKKEQISQIGSWNKRLTERIENQKKIKQLLMEVATQRKVFIENHRKRYQDKWKKIQEEIERRAHSIKRLKMRRVHKKKKKNVINGNRNKNQLGSISEYQEMFEQMLETELGNAVNAALDMEKTPKLPFHSDDPIYKVAKFIMQHIIATYDKDLSDDKVTFNCVSDCIAKFFDESKKFVIFRATQIIASAREFINQTSDSPRLSPQRYEFSKVSFSKFSHTIGTSSYEVHPFIDIRALTGRTPTPAGSLASIMIDSSESLAQKIKTHHLSRNDMVYIEHHIVKFQRQLIVGMGKRVFAAIRCHFANKIMDVRKELVDLDKQFLVKQATNAILSYSRNPVNFQTSLKICISALSSDIIWSLQQHLLRPPRDPRRIVPPRQCCKCESGRMKLCLYCH